MEQRNRKKLLARVALLAFPVYIIQDSSKEHYQQQRGFIMKVRKLFLATAMAISSTAFATAAPYGLEWGMTVEELKGKGVVLSEPARNEGVLGAKASERFATFGASNLADEDSGSAFNVHFDEAGRLQVITRFSPDFAYDPFAKEGLEAYDAAKASLGSDYDHVYSAEHIAPFSGGTAKGDTYPCLKSNRCGVWMSVFHNEHKGWAMVELQGNSRRSGVLITRFEAPGEASVTQ